MRMRTLKRAAAVTWGPLAGALACATIGLALTPIDLHRQTPTPATTLILAAVIVLLAAAITRRLKFQPPSARAQRVSMWLAAASRLVLPCQMMTPTQTMASATPIPLEIEAPTLVISRASTGM
mgnify:CR=1 FL=1